jgi:histidine ammonia-lyase
VETEINSVTDNPLIFEDEAISGGNFHGQPVALAMDFMKTAVAEWGNISERRIDRLVHPAYNRGLPAFLTEKGGVNSGWMIPQYVAASLVSENKILAHPASVDSIPTSAGKEDHVSMGTIAARQLQMITENVYYIYAIEAMAAAQGLTYRKPNRGGEGVDIAASLILDRMPPLNEDRWFKPEIEAVRDLFYSGDFIEIVEKALGKPLLP